VATYPVAVEVKAKDTASAVIGRSARKIGASLASMRANATSASSAITSAAGSIREATGRAALVGIGAIGAGLVGAGIAAKTWAQETLEAGDELATFAAKTGLSVEAIQEWRSAAQRSDVEIGTFNGSVQTFARQMALAREGTGKLASGLKKVSKPLLDQLKATTSTEEALELYISAMESVEDPARRAALASMAFGGAGKDMALLAVTGSEGVKKLRQEMRASGVMTTEQANRMGALDDQMIVLNDRYNTVKRTVGTAFLEAITPHLTKLAEWAEANQGVIAQNVGGAVDYLGTAFASIDWDAISSGAGKVYGAIEQIGGVAREAYENMVKLYDFGEELGDRAAGTYDELRSGIAGLVGVSATDTGADGQSTLLGGNTQVVTLEQQRRAYRNAAPALAMFGQSDMAERAERDAAAIQTARELSLRRVEAGRSGMYAVPSSASFLDRSMEALNAPRTAAERLNALPYGLGQVHSAGPPAPPQEITIKVESEPGTTATITKPPKAGNVKAGVRKVGTGAL
jgi:hypothetical protein